jgi:hypothetical protein
MHDKTLFEEISANTATEELGRACDTLGTIEEAHDRLLSRTVVLNELLGHRAPTIVIQQQFRLIARAAIAGEQAAMGQGNRGAARFLRALRDEDGQ